MTKSSYLFFQRTTISFVIIGLLAGCNLPGSSDGDDSQSVQIIQPQEGAQFEIGEEISVITNFSDPGGAQGILLEVNGVATRDDKFFSPMLQGRMNQPLRAFQEGPATLCVYLSTSSGKLLRSSCITVMIGFTNSLTTTPYLTLTTNPDATHTPTPTLAPDQGPPNATANQDANCRLGPGTDYGVKANLLTNQTAPIIGRSADSTWWVIDIAGSGVCWIWEGTVTVTGDTSRTPEKAPPPLPTATFTPPAPLSAPSLISPTGTQNCADVSGGATLKWSAVTHPNGIDHYEWELAGPISDSGSTGSTQAATKTLSCAGANFQWRVRAVDGLGNFSPWSAYMPFNVP